MFIWWALRGRVCQIDKPDGPGYTSCNSNCTLHHCLFWWSAKLFPWRLELIFTRNIQFDLLYKLNILIQLVSSRKLLMCFCFTCFCVNCPLGRLQVCFAHCSWFTSSAQTIFCNYWNLLAYGGRCIKCLNKTQQQELKEHKELMIMGQLLLLRQCLSFS